MANALHFTSDVARLEEVRQFVREATDGLRPSETSLFELQLVVVEAVTNVIEHAYQGIAGKPIFLEIECAGRDILLTLRDRGHPFDLGSHPDLDVARHVADGNRGGLGVFLMRRFLSDLALAREDGWNVMRMRFGLDS